MSIIHESAQKVLNRGGTQTLRQDAAPLQIPSVEWGGRGEALHFLHANGYPPACYQPLIERLTAEYHVFGMLLRPLWEGTDPRTIGDWKPFSEDLRQFLHQTGAEGVIGLGHSIGAVVTLRAAIQEPGLFRALILIDPVLLPPLQVVQLRIAHALGIQRGGRRLVEGALRRRRHFDDLEQMQAGYRRREVFRYFGDEELRALVHGLTRPNRERGYDLVYSPEWEARIYETGIWRDWDLWSGIPKLRIPMLFLRGEQTDTFFIRTAQMAQERNAQVQVQTIANATHLVPMERPGEVAEGILQFMEQSTGDERR